MEVTKTIRNQESNNYFSKIENFRNAEIDERNFRNPHPWV